MEGKGLLFKVFADVDVFDIEVDLKDPQKLIETIIAIAPPFGGINLEDIKAPECFEIETKVQEAVDIPVMHDDQHGTAIITSAGLLNALLINGKKLKISKLWLMGQALRLFPAPTFILSWEPNPKISSWSTAKV
jgi:malate dehydrogenase (oxaloacetate-decarboxylating)(NADP+)